MKESYIIRGQEKIHFITATVVGRGRCVYKEMVQRCDYRKFGVLHSEKGDNSIWLCSHIYLIVQSDNGKLEK